MKPPVLSRRNLISLAGVAGLALVPGLPACVDAQKKEPTGVRSAPKTVHVWLSRGNGSARFSEAQMSRLRLRIAGKLYPLTNHGESSLEAWRASGTRGRGRVGQREPTHFVSGALLSRVGVQSVDLLFFPTNGPPVAAGISLHVPRSPTTPSYVPDPEHVVDEDAAALWCIFQDPAVLALDPEVGAKVASLATSTQEYRVLADRIAELQWAVSPEEAEEGYGGWVRGIYTKDAAGKRIPMIAPDGSAIVDERGAPIESYTWEPHEDVAQLTLRAVGEVLRRVHDDTDLSKAGKFDTHPGVALTLPIAAAPSGKSVRGEGGESAYVFAHQNQKREGRMLSLETAEGSTSRFEVALTNALPLGIGWGITHFGDRNEVIDSQCFGYVPATFYAGISYAWSGKSKAESVIDLPAGAVRSTLWTTGLMFRYGDGVAPPSTETLGSAYELGVAISAIGSFLADFFLPPVMLCAGTGGEELEEIVEKPILAALKEVGFDALKEVLLALVNSGVRALTGAEVWGYMKREGVSVIYSALVGLGTSAASNLVKRAAVRILAGLAEAVAAISAESAIEAAIPIVGWALKVANVASTGVQLALAVGAAATEGAVTKSDLERIHTVKVTTKAFESAYFPPSAATYAATLAVGSVTTFAVEGRLVRDGTSGVEVAELAPFERVPAVGKATLTVQLFDPIGRVVGTALTTFDSDGRPGGEQQLAIEVEGKALPVESIQKLVHKQRLERQGANWQWKLTDVAPSASASALVCVPSSGAVGVCAITGLTVSQARGAVGLCFGTPVGTPPIISQLALDVSVVKPSPPFNASPGGDRSTSVYVVHGLGDVHAVLVSSQGGPLVVYPFDPNQDLNAFGRGAQRPPSLGTLIGTSLVHARVHPLTGTLVALTEAGLETLPLRADVPREAHLFGRRGQQAGQLFGPVAVAPFRDGAKILVLEQGARRAQVVDFYGNPIPAFGGPWLALSKSPSVTYLDCDVSDKGYAWILSTTEGADGGAVFDLDIYSPQGLLVRGLGGIAAARFALDRYNDLFSVAFENSPGPRDFPVPTLSLWYPQ